MRLGKCVFLCCSTVLKLWLPGSALAVTLSLSLLGRAQQCSGMMSPQSPLTQLELNKVLRVTQPLPFPSTAPAQGGCGRLEDLLDCSPWSGRRPHPEDAQTEGRVCTLPPRNRAVQVSHRDKQPGGSWRTECHPGAVLAATASWKPWVWTYHPLDFRTVSHWTDEILETE